MIARSDIITLWRKAKGITGNVQNRECNGHTTPHFRQNKDIYIVHVIMLSKQ